MRRGFFQKFKDSLIRPAFAAEITAGSRPMGAGSYFFLLLLLSVVITTAVIAAEFYGNGAVGEFRMVVEEYVPYFNFDGDSLRIDVDTPLVFGGSESDGVYMVLSPYEMEQYPDMNGIMEFNGQRLYVGPDSVYVYTPQYGSVFEERLNYSDMNINGSFGKEDLLSLVYPFSLLIVAAFFFFGLLGAYIGSAVFMLIVALIGWVISSVMGLKLRYGQIYALSVFAMTAEVILKTVINSANWLAGSGIELNWLASYGLTLVFLALYLFRIKRAADNPYEGDAIIDVAGGNISANDNDRTLPPFDPGK